MADSENPVVMTIRSKLVLCLLFTTLLPVLLIATLAIIQARSEAMQHFVDASGREIQQVDRALSDAFQTVFNDVAYFATLPQLDALGPQISNYTQLAGEQRMASAGKPGIEGELYRLFEQFGLAHPGLAYIYVGTEHGGIVQWPQGKVSAPYDPRRRAWYAQAMANPRQSQLTQAYYWPGDGATIVSVVHAVVRDGRKLGVMAMDVSLRGLTETVGRIRIGESGFLMLVEDSGTVLVDPSNPAHNFQPLAGIEAGAYAALAGAGSGVVSLTLHGERYQAQILKSPKLGWKFIGLVKQSEIYAHANRMAWTMVAISAALLVVLFVLGGWFAGLISRPVRQVAEGLHAIAVGGGGLEQRLRIRSRDETAVLARRFNAILDTIQHLVKQTGSRALAVGGAAQQVDQVARSISKTARSQLQVLDNASVAVSHMAESAETIAANSARAAAAARDGEASVNQGELVVDRTVGSVSALGGRLRQAATSLQELASSSRGITAILDVIRGIADQTNLLALNAAIEAARAGEHGRGFAVVADEVRALAQRTQQSTTQIQQLLDRLAQGTSLVVHDMERSLAQSDEAVALSDATRTVFENVSQAVRIINDMNAQIAAASVTQHQASRSLHGDIGEVCAAAIRVLETADAASSHSDGLVAQATGLEQLVSHFGVGAKGSSF